MPNVLGMSFFNAVGSSTMVDPSPGAIFNVMAR
jgi:hypothetical protein